MEAVSLTLFGKHGRAVDVKQPGRWVCRNFFRTILERNRTESNRAALHLRPANPQHIRALIELKDVLQPVACSGLLVT